MVMLVGWKLLLGAAAVAAEDVQNIVIPNSAAGRAGGDSEEVPMSSEQIRGIHTKIDANSDGKISLQEIMDYAKQIRREIDVKDISFHFEDMDGNKDGKLTVEEMLKDVVSRMGEVTAKEKKAFKALELAKFKASDDNGDGVLDVSELPPFIWPEMKEAVLLISTKDALEKKDTDNDGELSESEFGEENEDDFGKVDKDGSGKISLDELTHWESGFFQTEKAMRELFETIDKDGDLHVTADELDAARPELSGTDAHYTLQEWVAHYEEPQETEDTEEEDADDTEDTEL